MPQTPVTPAEKLPHLYLRRNGIFYLISYDSSGKRHFKSTNTPNKESATKQLEVLKAEHLDQHRSFSAPPPDPNFSFLWKTYQELYAPRLREGTLRRTYKPFIENFLVVLGDRPFSKYSALDIQTFIAAREKRNLSRHTVNGSIRALKTVANWAVTMNLVPPANPFSRCKLLEVPDTDIQFLTKGEFNAIVEKETKQDWKDLYIYAVLTGVRLSAILNAQWKHLDLDADTIEVGNDRRRRFLTKSGRNQIIPMHQQLKPILQARRKRHPNTLYVFENEHALGHQPYSRNYPSHRFLKVARMANVNHAYFHMLRASYGSWLAKAGRNIFQIQKLLGHSDPSTTARHYAHLLASDLHDEVNSISI